VALVGRRRSPRPVRVVAAARRRGAGALPAGGGHGGPAPSVSSLLRVAEAQARYQPAAATAAELASLLGRCTPGQRARLIDATRQCVAENQEVVLMSRNNSTGEARQ